MLTSSKEISLQQPNQLPHCSLLQMERQHLSYRAVQSPFLLSQPSSVSAPLVLAFKSVSFSLSFFLLSFLPPSFSFPPLSFSPFPLFLSLFHFLPSFSPPLFSFFFHLSSYLIPFLPSLCFLLSVFLNFFLSFFTSFFSLLGKEKNPVNKFA